MQRELLPTLPRHRRRRSSTAAASVAGAGRPDDTRASAVPPYYLSMKMPGQKQQAFSLTTTFTPNKRADLGAFMAVDADARSHEYGKIRMLRLPPNATVDGPAQVQSKFNSDRRRSPSRSTTSSGGDSDGRVRQSADRATGRRPPVRGAGLRPRAGHDYPLLKKVSGHLRRGDRVRGHPGRGAGQGLRQPRAVQRHRASDGRARPTEPASGPPTPTVQAGPGRRPEGVRRRPGGPEEGRLGTAYGEAQDETRRGRVKPAERTPKATARTPRTGGDSREPGRVGGLRPRGCDAPGPGTPRRGTVVNTTARGGAAR